MEVGAKEFGDKIAIVVDLSALARNGKPRPLAGKGCAHISSKGEIKMSLNEMTCHVLALVACRGPCCLQGDSHILVSQVFQQLQLAVCSFGENGSAEGLHYLFHRDRLGSKLILCRARTIDVLELGLAV